jgi:hypothetical protein
VEKVWRQREERLEIERGSKEKLAYSLLPTPFPPKMLDKPQEV